LSSFISSGEEDRRISVNTEKDPISGSDMNPQFKNAIPDRLAVTVISRFFYTAQPRLHDATDLSVNPVKKPAAKKDS
jgi:hypothetical protein